jgi:hypothetical protein
VNLAKLEFDQFDGRHWEQSIVGYKEKREQPRVAK